MIQPLRSIHRRASYALAIGLPVLLVSALLARHTEPPIPMGGQETSITSARGFAYLKVSVSSVVLTSNRDRVHPEIIVYWTPDSIATKPDQNSVYLGRLLASEPLTVARPTGAGSLLFYSPATGTTIDTASIGGKP